MSLHEPMHVLAVDDDELNLIILVKHLSNYGYAVVQESRGLDAYDYLVAHPDEIAFVLLDRMMADVDGMEIVRKLQSHPTLKFMPVIIESGKVGNDLFSEAYEAGASYYLVKPFDDMQMRVVCNAAKYDVIKYRQLCDAMSTALPAQETYSVHSFQEAVDAVGQIARSAKDATATALGLFEVVLNGLEHAALALDADLKWQALEKGDWHEVLEQAMAKAGVSVSLTVTKQNGECVVEVTDQGKGFEWQQVLNEFDPEVITKPFGKGLIKAQRYLKALNFNQQGNSVACVFETTS